MAFFIWSYPPILFINIVMRGGFFVKKWHQKFRRGLIKYMELPSDVILELPRITMIGQLHVYIENHQGLILYSDAELQLKTHKGYIQVLGSSFVLKKMYPAEILLEGIITDIKFISNPTNKV